jgi:HK97 family phage major capsid protein
MLDSPPNLDEYRSVEELQTLGHQVHDAMLALEVETNGLPFTSEQKDKFAGLVRTKKDIAARVKELRARQAMLLENAKRPGAVESMDDAYYPPTRSGLERRPGEPRHLAEARDSGLRMIDSKASVLSARAGDTLEELVRDEDPDGSGGRYLSAVGADAYLTAFRKLLADPTTGHLRFTPAEVEAVRAVSAAQSEQRAMSIGTGSAGGYAVPFVLDPSVMLTSNGALNPVRQIARQVTITGAREWRGVSSDGVSAAYVAEATVATDASPTLVQPAIITYQWRVFVPFSIELGQDWAGIDEELLRMSSDARDVNDATQFLSGNGTNAPVGLLAIGTTGSLTTTQRVQSATTATYALADPWALSAAIPARFRASTTYAAAPAIWDQTYRFVGGNSTEPYQFSGGARDGNFLGQPKVEWSTMATTTTTGSKVMVAGDFTGFTIVDRLGTTMELIPHLFTASQGLLPSGQRGVYIFGRSGSGVTMPNAFRYLEVK